MRRENKAMRLASALLVLTLLATSMIAGTFAKYTAEGTGNATARVAKFGVDVTVDTANLFGEQYSSAGTVVETGAADITVQANPDGDVVAPGTTGSMTFTVSGTPEVAVNLEVTVENTDGTDNAEIERVMLAAGTYKYDADSNKDAVTVDVDYYPVKWTLKKGVVNGTDVAGCVDVDLNTINNYFATSQDFTKEYDAGTDLGDIEKYTLSWKWAYEDASTDKAVTDAKDTLLGDLAADVTGFTEGDANTPITQDNAANYYCLTEAFNFKITVTQAD